jgi:hypothetical protein
MTILTRNVDVLRKEVEAHLAADALVAGRYWFSRPNAVGGKGCFIGCLTHSEDPSPAHERFGLTVSIMRIAENIFEALPQEDGRAFFAALPGAVEANGKDLSRVHWAFLASELRALPKVGEGTQSAIDRVIEGMDLLAIGKEWSVDAAAYAADAYAAAAAAYAAAAAAAAAAADAAAAAYAYADADAYAADAYAAAAAAYADADAYAAAAADAAADAYARVRQRDTLLRLIKEAPMGVPA